MCVTKKRQSFANISLSRNCISDLISDVVADMDYQLMEKIVSFEVFSFGIDESTDITDFAQLATFIHGDDASLTVTEEFVQLVPTTGMTKAEDILGSLVGALDSVGVDCARAVSVDANDAPSMTRRKAIKIEG